MSNYEFQSSLYRNETEMLNAIAYAWVGGGSSDHEYMRGIMAELTDAELAAECVKGWQLDEQEKGWPGDDETKSHMDENNYNAGDLRHAFERLRELLAQPDDEEVK